MGLVRGLAGRNGWPEPDVRTAFLGHAPPSVGQVASAAESRAGRETSNSSPHTVHWKG